MFITKHRSAAADLLRGIGAARRCRCSMRWCPRRPRSRRPTPARRRCASGSCTSRTAPTWRRGRRPPPARTSSCRRRLKAARAAQGLAGRGQQPEARRRRRRDARGRRIGLAERRGSEAHRGAGLPDRHDDRSGARAARSVSASPFPSLEFATEDFTGYVGGCTPGYSCAYMNTISWATPTTPLPMEINPRTAFERLFGDGGSEDERRRHRARRPEHPRCHCRRGARRSSAGSASHDRVARRPTTSTTCARSSAGFSRPRRSSATELGCRRQAARHSRVVRRAHGADVRPARDGDRRPI